MLQHAATHCDTLQHTHYFAVDVGVAAQQHTATCCNTLQHAATRCNTLITLQWMWALQRRNTLQHNTLQHASKHCNTQQHASPHA